jgi:amino acid adenylation domain-containing protein
VSAGCLHEIVQCQAASHPDAVAVRCEDESLTYQELNRRANRLARYLYSLGARTETPVAVLLDRTTSLIVSLLGILKAGAAYVPLDPAYPPERLAMMMREAAVPLVITQGSLASRLPHGSARIITLASDANRIAQEADSNPDFPARSDQLAYIIYTSGSTGRPKGIAVAHSSVAHLFSATGPTLRLNEHDTWTAVHSCAFDFSVWEIWGALAHGSQLVVVPLSVAQSSIEFGELLRKRKVTILSQTPSALRQLLRDVSIPASVRIVISGGEALPQDMVKPLLATGIEAWNFYGPTETTVWASAKKIEASDACYPFAPVGRAIQGNGLYVLDSALQPAFEGAAGELHIGGPNLARGYYQRPELTAEKFVPNPWGEFGSRLYKTGDSTRMLPNGEVEFLGRLDHQVKIRGFRIELGEIEACLRSHPDVDEAVVVDTSGTTESDRKLVAYIVPQSDAGMASTPVVAQWQTVHDETYRLSAAAADPTFNIVGWNSSYDGLPIPAEQMREWVDSTVQRVLTLCPRRVLEIGCGVGLLLFRIAPRCERYVGTDFSPAAIGYIRNHLPQVNLPQVELQQREASDLEGFKAGGFDTVILNSVIQYFPRIEYLIDLIEKATHLLAPGGRIFLGDLRSLPLLNMLHTSVEFERASDSMRTAELRRRVLARVNREEELVIDPALFLALRTHIPRLQGVSIQPKRGRYHNELTRFRLDVILTADEGAAETPTVDWLDWDEQRFTAEGLRQRWQKQTQGALGIRGVPNARLQPTARIQTLMASEAHPETVGELRRALAFPHDGADPEDLWRWGEETASEVSIGWSARGPECFDVLLRQGAIAPETADVDPGAVSSLTWGGYANQPVRSLFDHEFAVKLRSHIQEKLPNYMRPSAYQFLDRLPLSANGKVDRGRLPLPDPMRPELGVAYEPPQTETEKLLATIWAEALGHDRVGRNDNFFVDLGGHSLVAMQIVSRIRDRLEIELSLRSMFDYPTVASCAMFVEILLMSEIDG